MCLGFYRAQAHPPVRTPTYIYQVANRLFKTFKVPNTDHTYLFIEILLETKQQPDRNVTASSSQTLKKHLWDGHVSLTQALRVFCSQQPPIVGKGRKGGSTTSCLDVRMRRYGENLGFARIKTFLHMTSAPTSRETNPSAQPYSCYIFCQELSSPRCPT